MLSADAFLAFIGAFLIQLGVVIYGYGRLIEKVKNISQQIAVMDKKMHETPCPALQTLDKLTAVHEERINGLTKKAG